ncbi:MAG TPA: tRNA-dihydrouridine synthase [Phycisphaerae bacterium]|nr:tRNA-dihydrouridine synthase [Phycisphaerae bacterium]HPS53743.1 tRNA-dihydrouridine synthase [Phycisphaerae bacterium]
MKYKPFHIGSIEIDFPVILAPLAGYSDAPFRSICRQLGAPYATSEMVLDRCVTAKTRKPRPILEKWPNESPVAAQIVGDDPEEMVAAAKAMLQRGYDVIDMNFACPVHKALSRRRGGYMMSQPQRVLEIIRAVRDAIPSPVTLKVRRKFRDEDSEENFWQIARGAREAGLDAITVHARSVEQKYTGVADWDFLRRVKQQFQDWTVIGSGDVLTAAAALKMLDETGVDAAAVARGVLGNPWIFRQARELAAGKPEKWPSIAEQKAIMLRHMDDVVRLYGLKGPGMMRKFGIKYARLHPQAKKVRMAFVNIKTQEQWNAVLDEYYNE